MRRFVLLLVLAVSLATLGGAAAAPIDWKTLPYFNYANQQLRLVTDASWRGAHPVDASNFNWQPDPSWPQLKKQWIWAATCGTAAQRVSFSKTFLVPGVPSDGLVNLYYGPGNQFYSGRPYTSAVLQVNGVEIGRLHDLARFPRKFDPQVSVTLAGPMLKAFRHGSNTVVIRVERPALKKGDRCTHPSATSGGNVRYIAVAADLSLNFASDLVAVPPQTARQAQLVTNGQNATITGTVRFTNRGPSTSLGGTLLVTASGPGLTLLIDSLTQPRLPLKESDCKRETGRLTCTYEELKAGQQLAINIAAGTKVNTGFFRNGAGKLEIRWTIVGKTRDPGKTYDNEALTTAILCLAGATDSAC